MATVIPTLSARLYQGYVSITGAASITGIVVNDKGYQFGLVNQIYSDVPDNVSVGDSIMFKVEDTINVTYSNTTYFLLPMQKIILIEIVLT